MRYRVREWVIAVTWLGALIAIYKWYGGASVWYLITLSAIIILGGLILQMFGAHHIELKRHINPGRPTVGTEVEVEVNIEFRSYLPLPWMIITDHFTEGNYSKLLFPGWGRSFTYKYYLHHIPRGIIAFQVCRVEWGGLFRYFKNSHLLPCDKDIIVLPTPTVIPLEERWTFKDIRAGEFEGYQQHRSVSHWGLELRDYAEGDPLSRVHWKSSARLGRLQTRLPEEEVDQELYIILDQFPESYKETDHEVNIGKGVVQENELRMARDSFEWAVSIVSGLLQTSNGEGIHTELFSVGGLPNPLTATSISDQTILAIIELNGTKRVSHVMEEAADQLIHGTRVAVVTGRLHDDLTRTAAIMQRKGLKVDIYSIMAPASLSNLKEVDGERIRQDKIANSLIKLGVRLYRLNVASSEKKYDVNAVSSKEVISYDDSYTEHRKRYV
jgi:uncharacterized protein (DUF58 family)